MTILQVKSTVSDVKSSEVNDNNNRGREVDRTKNDRTTVTQCPRREAKGDKKRYEDVARERIMKYRVGM